ncbi:MAG TPA: DUF3341 domain-containing protein [Longimicrobiales bacterium]|nr:DUF3341 domain-containing protein [Longimicrobiales bacterium]
MSTLASNGVLASFAELDAATGAIKALRKRGLKDLVVFSPVPHHDIEHALEPSQSPVRIFTLVGGLTGTASGFALATYASMSWPLVTGGKPIISIPAFVIPAFELTILLGALSTVAGLFINARLPRARTRVVYDPAFSVDHFGVLVVPPSDRVAEATKIFQEYGAVEVRQDAGEVRIGTL